MAERKIVLMQLLLLIMGCSTNYEYWDISQFKIVPNALKDGEKIKVIYTSRGPDNNEDLEYFFHLIVISQKTGDTINLLTTDNNSFQIKESDVVYNYFDSDNPSTKLGQLIRMNIDTIFKIKHIEEVNKYKLKEISKIARDPDFDEIAKNNYPTVFGSIGKLTKNEVE